MVDIKKTISANGKTIKEIAEQLGMSRQGFYFHIQQGDKVSIEILMKIANILGCSVSDFLTAEDDTQKIKCPHCGKKIIINKE